MTIAVVYGTRPEAVKLSPLIPLLDTPLLIWTGQHPELADGLLQPTIRLHLPSTNDPLSYAAQLRTMLRSRIAKASCVVVQGDTASAYAGALAASDLGIPVAHVEAGLRSGNLQDPYPEESFRIGIDEVARYCFCPTDWAAQNLDMEPNHHGREIHVTGNTGIDALYAKVGPVEAPFVTQQRVMVTLHRRESFGAPLKEIVAGLLQAAKRFPAIDFFWPVHPNPEVQKAAFGPMRGFARNVYLLPPLHPHTFSTLLSTSRAVLTDSGGVQEEAAALGIPCVIARDVTDRPESVENFQAILAGRTSTGVFQALNKALTFQLRSSPSHVFGDGHAAEKIASILQHQEVPV